MNIFYGKCVIYFVGNVVWMDKISASRALLKLSSDPKEQTEIVTEDTTEDKTDGTKDAETGDISDTSDDRGDKGISHS